MTITPTPAHSPVADASGLVYSRLFLPTPLELSQAGQFLRRLAAERRPHRFVLETLATPGGILHLIGTEATHVHQLRRLLGDLIPGVVMAGLGSEQRIAPVSVGRITVKPAGLPLEASAAEQATRALYSAFSHRLHTGEAISLQVVLGHGIHPAHTPAKIADPRPLGIWQALTTGTTPAPTDLRSRIRDRQSDYGLQVSIRVAAAGDDPARRQRFIFEVLSALSILEAPGVDVAVSRDKPERFTRAVLHRPLRLSVTELVGVAGWPVGAERLPGMPPGHPKLLRLDPAANSTERVFARSAIPGDERLVGITRADSGMHGIAVGPTGVGKSTALEHLILASIRDGDAVAVIDPKSEMPEFLRARIPRERWKDIREIDGAAGEPLGFNPLDAAGRDPDVVADGILAVFAKIFASGWGPRTADIYSASLRTLIRASDPKAPSTLLDLPRLWTDDRYRRRLVAAVSNDPGLAGFWAWFDALKPAQRMNVLAAPMNKLRQVLLKPAAVKILGQRNPGFRLRDIFRDRLIVILPTNPALMGEETAALISALAIADIWQAVQERVTDPERSKHQGHVFVDEADRLMHLPVSLSDALARSRSMHVSWWLAVQGWHQMPTEMQSAAKTNARTKLIFKAEDDDEAKVIARMAPELEPVDLLKLDRFQAYLKPVIGGVTRDWALVQTLPPEPAQHDPDEVLAASREACPPSAPDNYTPQATPSTDEDEQSAATETGDSETNTEGAADEVFGVKTRKRQ